MGSEPGRDTAMGPRGRAFLTAALLAAATALVIRLQAPPRPLPAQAPPSVFSAGRAMDAVRDLAQRPHPPGSADHDRVRDLLVARLRALGFRTEVQARMAHRVERAGLAVGSVENVVAEKTGKDPTGTLLLVAHYDSHTTGPGAADDASGVATLLEVARALPPGRNTLRILVTDGEEMGLLGAQAYVDALRDPRPELVLNFESRGGGGPLFMFETSPGNGRLIRAFARWAPRPHASSLMYALYRMLPNDTDLTVFKGAGLAGLNFAFVGNWQVYHTPLDRPSNLDAASLQQEGATALALARHFLDADLASFRPGGADAVYFDLLGRLLVHHPLGLVWPLSLLALLAAVALGWALRGEENAPRALLLGAGLALGTLLLGALAGQAVGWAVGPFRRGVPNLDPSGVRWFEAALAFAGLALLLPAWSGALRRFRGRVLPLGALLPWLLALLGLSAFLPGGAYLVLWPLLGALLGLALDRPWIAAFPLLLLVVPVWHELSLLLGFGLPSALGLLLAFSLLPLLPLLRRVLQAGTLPVGGVLLLAGAACFAVGARQPSPHQDALAYVMDLDAARAEWVSLLPPDGWTAPLLGPHPARTRLAGRLAWAGPAPIHPQPQPTFTRDGATLHLALPVRALALSVETDTPVAFRTGGQTLPQDRRLLWFAPPTALDLQAPPGTRATVSVILDGLPPGPGPRPEGCLPAPVDPFTDVRILRRTVSW